MAAATRYFQIGKKFVAELDGGAAATAQLDFPNLPAGTVNQRWVIEKIVPRITAASGTLTQAQVDVFKADGTSRIATFAAYPAANGLPAVIDAGDLFGDDVPKVLLTTAGLTTPNVGLTVTGRIEQA